MTFYELIEVLCKERGVTTQIMAMRIGVPYGTVRNWKNNGSIPRWQTLIKLSEYFRVPRDYFLDFKKRKMIIAAMKEQEAKEKNEDSHVVL